MTRLRFGVLGPLEVTRDGESVRVPPGRQRAVLACLLVNANQPVPADVLVEAAWGDRLPRAPDAALRTVLSRLRSVLGQDAIRRHPAGYVLCADESGIDACRFEDLHERACSMPAQQAVALLDEALDLWDGAAYAEFADRDFATPEAQRLERRRLEAIEELAAATIDLGDHDAAVDRLEGLLAQHPFREYGVQLLLTALYRADRQADALERFRSYRALLADELGLDPSPALRELEARILTHDLPRPDDEPAGQLPAWLDTSTALIGRDRALSQLTDAVLRDRLVSVTGIGGVGKSRLVAEALPALHERLRMPVAVVELASARPSSVAAAVADSLGIRPRAGPTVADVVEYLSTERMLVVLDNCEHVLAEASRLTGLILRRCPQVRVVVTSRRRLGVRSERVLPLTPLPAPRPGSRESTSAVQLLTDRICRLRPGFRLTPGSAESMGEICRRLDGVPLAIELAASRVATIGVEPVLAAVTASATEGASRELAASIEWSVRLLNREQRRLLLCLAVFVGDVDLPAVEAFGRHLGPWQDPAGIAGLLDELVECHLVARHGDGDGDGDGNGRGYRMLEVVRSYARSRLADSGLSEAARHAHARWAAEVAEQAAADWTGGGPGGGLGEASRRLSRFEPDLAAALRWAMATGRLDIATQITGQLASRLHWLPGAELDHLVLQVADRCAAAPDRTLAMGVAAGAMAATLHGDVGRAQALARIAWASADEAEVRLLSSLAMAISALYAGDHRTSSTWLDRATALPGLAPAHRVEPHITRALLLCYGGRTEAARAEVQVALLGAETVGAGAAKAFALYAAGEIETKRAPLDAARLYRTSAGLADRAGAVQVSQVSRLALLAVLVREGSDREAVELARPLLADLRRVGAWPQVWTMLRITSELLVRRERHQDAALLLAAAESAPSAPPLIDDDIARYRHLTAQLHDHLGDTTLALIADLAASLPRVQVADRAAAVLGELGDRC